MKPHARRMALGPRTKNLDPMLLPGCDRSGWSKGTISHCLPCFPTFLRPPFPNTFCFGGVVVFAPRTVMDSPGTLNDIGLGVAKSLVDPHLGD